MNTLPSRQKDVPFYWSWQNMKMRCSKPTNPNYPRYGGRGITYAQKWETFEGFYEDMSSTYQLGLTLDRIDNNGNYEPSNCRWADMKVQSNNRRNSRNFTIKGMTKTLAQWCDESAVKPSTVKQRFYGLGWSIEKALNTPTGKHQSNKLRKELCYGK